MASYFDEHRMFEQRHDELWLARLIVEGGWTDDLGLTFERLFPDKSRAAHPDAIKELETMYAEDIDDQKGQCLICLDTWSNADEREKVIKIPCRHLYHSRCILAWFQKMEIVQANSCPSCRHELPSHDPLYEEYKKQQKRKEERQADLDELHNSMFS